MHVDVNGTRLWFDVDGPALVPDGDAMRRRPTEPDEWSLERCADDVAAVCDQLGIDKPVVVDGCADRPLRRAPPRPRRRRGRPRRLRELGSHGMERVRAVDLVDSLGGVETAILVVVGTEDPVTPIAAAEEIVEAMPPGRARLEVLPEAGHFPWLDQPDRLRAVLADFVTSVTAP